jgi:hypothetical protein
LRDFFLFFFFSPPRFPQTGQLPCLDIELVARAAATGWMAVDLVKDYEKGMNAIAKTRVTQFPLPLVRSRREKKIQQQACLLNLPSFWTGEERICASDLALRSGEAREVV